MKILIACEESQIVTSAFRAKGHEAFSCDILPTSGDHPEWHLQGDFRKYIFDGWDMLIAHPPCTYLCNSGVRWLKGNPDRFEKMLDASQLFKMFLGFDQAGISRICVENPIPHKHAALPPLVPTDIVGPPPKDRDKKEWDKVHRASPGPDRAKMRSKTLLGYGQAMANQWG